jgi:hypothetical protein
VLYTSKPDFSCLRTGNFPLIKTARATLKIIALLLALNFLSIANASSTAEEKVQLLLSCATIIASSEENDLDYEDYVIAAAHLSADNNLSLEWLNEQVKHAFDTAYDFAGQEGVAAECVTTLNNYYPNGE